MSLYTTPELSRQPTDFSLGSFDMVSRDDRKAVASSDPVSQDVLLNDLKKIIDSTRCHLEWRAWMRLGADSSTLFEAVWSLNAFHQLTAQKLSPVSTGNALLIVSVLSAFHKQLQHWHCFHRGPKHVK